MGMNVNDWIDGWFLSLSDNPDKLDKRIRSYESARMLAFFTAIVTLVIQMLLVFKTGKDSALIWFLVLLQLTVLYSSDIYIKVLKLMRQQRQSARMTQHNQANPSVAKKRRG